jgi:hypothetical protein
MQGFRYTVKVREEDVDCLISGGGVEGEDASKEGAALAALAEKMGGGMRLTLTQQEAAARENVVLPWEQRQHGALSQVHSSSRSARPIATVGGVQGIAVA